MNQSFIPPHGGYHRLQSYQKAEIIYDATVYFTKRFFRTGDRTVDQMVQAARSGKQNIAEASLASGTSLVWLHLGFELCRTAERVNPGRTSAFSSPLFQRAAG